MVRMVSRLWPKRFAHAALLLTVSCSVLQAQDAERSEAFHLEQQGRVQDAESVWRKLSEEYPKQAEPWAHVGLLEARQEHYAEAIASYRKALTLNPSMPGLKLNLGLALFKAADYRQAIEVLKPLLTVQPTSSPEAQRLRILLGMSYYGMKDFALATPYLKKAVEADTNNQTLLLTLAHSCLLSKQYQCVLDTFHRMVELNADSAEAHMLTGEALDAMRDTLGAIREFRAAAAANPKEPNVHFGLGYLLWTQGQYAEAVKEFQAELDNDPGHAQAQEYLADAYIQMNRMEDAEPILEKLRSSDASNAKVHLDLGIVYEEQGQKDAALMQFREAVRLAPTDVNAHWRLGRLYRSQGKTEEAKAEFERAKSLNKKADDELLKVMSKVPSDKQDARGVPAN